MKLKKPSLSGMKNCEYLGHFAQDKFIQQGHNDSGKPDLRENKAGLESGGGPGSFGGGGRDPQSVLRAMNDYAVKNKMNTRSNEYMLKSRSPEGYSNRAREMANEIEQELGKRFDKEVSTKNYDEWLKFSNVVDKLRKGSK